MAGVGNRAGMFKGITAATIAELINKVDVYVQDLQADLEDVINANPQSDEERHALFLRKRRYIDDLLEEVAIDGDRQIYVKFRVDVLRLVQGNKVA
jgi:hypothetical protein